jgi:hypothetical protein
MDIVRNSHIKEAGYLWNGPDKEPREQEGQVVDEAQNSLRFGCET